jgi:hypothetical protein
MAFKQFTHCTPSSSFDPLNRPLAIFGGIAGFVALILAIIVGGIIAPWLIVAGAAAGWAAISSVFEYLLGGKLICLDGDKLAVGQVIGLEPANEKPFPDNFDNDLSINICLCPHRPDIGSIISKGHFDAEDIPDLNLATPGFQDFLVMEQPASKNHGIPYSGYDTAPFLNKPNLHIELEGSRISDMYAACMAIWWVLTAGAAIASALPWPFNLIVMLIAALIAGIIFGATWASSDDGSLSDVDMTEGGLSKGDFIVSFGTWTYDSGHNDTNVGWNELHPVKFMSKAEHCADEKEAETWKELITESLGRAASGLSKDADWYIHPVIDSCDQKEKDNGNIR